MSAHPGTTPHATASDGRAVRGGDHESAAEPVRCEPLSYLEANAARDPEATAIWQDDETTSFAALRDRAWELIAELRRRDAGDGAVVAVLLPNIAAYVALEVAVPAAGATLFPLPTGIGPRELASVLTRAGARLLISDDSERGTAAAEIAAGLPEPVGSTPVAELERVARAIPATQRPSAAPAEPERIVQIALTSGTTGMPKLASLSAQLKQLTFEGFTSRLRIDPQDRMFPMSPITQGVGEMCLYALRRGTGLVMLGAERFDPDRALAIAQRSGATVLGGVPTMLGRMLQSPEVETRPLPRLRLTVSAGAPLAPAVAREWEQRVGGRVGSFYGAMDIGQLAVPDPEDPAQKRWTTVGRPHETAQWRVVAPDGSPLGAGQTGEICMRGPLVQDRYWGEDATPFDDDGWAHFGDLGFVDEDGFVHITGRLKDTIIRGGNNINPLEVEELLREHPDIREACVVGRADPDLGERAVAFVVASSALTLERLTEWLAGRGLTRYKWPERLELVELLPTGATGKVNRTALRERAAARMGGDRS